MLASMLQWLLRLFGLVRDDRAGSDAEEPARSLPAPAEEPEDAPERASVVESPPGAAASSPGPDPAVASPLQPQDPPWVHSLAVRTLEPTILRRHALDAIEALDTASQADERFVKRLQRLVEANQLDLPPFPAVARELDSLLKETTTDILQIARVVERDPGLVRRVWTQARSALYASPPRSLHHAVARVGLDALWRIGMSVCLNDTVLRVEGFEAQATELREVGIATAEVAAALGNEKRGNLYMAGLLHDVGRLLVLRAAGDGEPPSPELLRAAQDAVGAHLAVLVTDSWGLDDAVAAGVGFSPAASNAPDKHRQAAKVVRAATVAANAASLVSAGHLLGNADPDSEVTALGFDPLVANSRAEEVLSQLRAPPAQAEPA